MNKSPVIKTAIILAAGLGSRLGNVIDDNHKSLLEMAGRPLLALSLDNLANYGTKEVVIVLGHQGNLLRKAVGTHWLGMDIIYIDNPHYATTGSVLSLMYGVENISSQSMLVLESDILYHPDFLSYAESHGTETIMVADLSKSGDEVYICAENGAPIEYLGKKAPKELRDQSLGEFAGISVISYDFAKEYIERTKTLFVNGTAKGHYEELMFEMSKDGHTIRVCHCPDRPWSEVDTMADLIRCRELVLPRFMQQNQTITRSKDKKCQEEFASSLQRALHIPE